MSKHVSIRLEGWVCRDITLDLLFFKEYLRDARKSRFIDLGLAVAAGFVHGPREGVERKRFVVRALKVALFDNRVALLLQRPNIRPLAERDKLCDGLQIHGIRKS